MSSTKWYMTPRSARSVRIRKKRDPLCAVPTNEIFDLSNDVSIACAEREREKASEQKPNVANQPNESANRNR